MPLPSTLSRPRSPSSCHAPSPPGTTHADEDAALRLPTPPWRGQAHPIRARGRPPRPRSSAARGMAECSAGASGYIGVVTFDEKPAAALVPGDQVVYRDGSQMARADLRTIASV